MKKFIWRLAVVETDYSTSKYYFTSLKKAVEAIDKSSKVTYVKYESGEMAFFDATTGDPVCEIYKEGLNEAENIYLGSI